MKTFIIVRLLVWNLHEHLGQKASFSESVKFVTCGMTTCLQSQSSGVTCIKVDRINGVSRKSSSSWFCLPKSWRRPTFYLSLEFHLPHHHAQTTGLWTLPEIIKYNIDSKCFRISLKWRSTLWTFPVPLPLEKADDGSGHLQIHLESWDWLKVNIKKKFVKTTRCKIFTWCNASEWTEEKYATAINMTDWKCFIFGLYSC